MTLAPASSFDSCFGLEAVEEITTPPPRGAQEGGTSLSVAEGWRLPALVRGATFRSTGRKARLRRAGLGAYRAALALPEGSRDVCPTFLG